MLLAGKLVVLTVLFGVGLVVLVVVPGEWKWSERIGQLVVIVVVRGRARHVPVVRVRGDGGGQHGEESEEESWHGETRESCG